MGLFGPNIKKMKAEKDLAGLEQVIRESRNHNTRVKAITALADLAAVKSLIAIMADPVVMAVTVPFIIKLGDKAVKPLIKALDDKDYYIQGGVATALGQINASEALDPLIEKAKDKNCKARVPMILALGEMGGDKAKEAIQELTLDQDPNVSQAALLELGKILTRG